MFANQANYCKCLFFSYLSDDLYVIVKKKKNLKIQTNCWSCKSRKENLGQWCTCHAITRLWGTELLFWNCEEADFFFSTFLFLCFVLFFIQTGWCFHCIKQASWSFFWLLKEQVNISSCSLTLTVCVFVSSALAPPAGFWPLAQSWCRRSRSSFCRPKICKGTSWRVAGWVTVQIVFFVFFPTAHM